MATAITRFSPASTRLLRSSITFTSVAVLPYRFLKSGPVSVRAVKCPLAFPDSATCTAPNRRSFVSSAVMSRPRDIDAFLASYKGQSSPSVDGQADNNLRFYKNEIVCQPDGLKYESWMKRYENDLVELEMNHGYVQWFFPIREQGVNHLAQPLDVHEIEAMKEDPAVLDRLLRSYKMMLRFYGIEFNDGHLKLSEDYKERLLNLKQRPHNLLRITRIMKHLSEFPQLQPHVAPLVLFFVALHSEGLLDFSQGSMRGDSLDRWWSNVFRDEEERSAVRRIVGARGKLGGKDWGWEEYGRWMSERGEKGYTGSEVERG